MCCPQAGGLWFCLGVFVFRQQAVDLMKNAEFEFSGHYPRKSLGYGGEIYKF